MATLACRLHYPSSTARRSSAQLRGCRVAVTEMVMREKFVMNKLALSLVLGLAVVGCSARARVAVQAKAPEPPKQEEPAPPPPEEPKAGEQIVLPEQIEFEFDQARIKQTPKTLEALNKLASVMKSHPNITKLRIEGHTDNVGKNKHNEKLSKARAEAVAKWLTQHDVPASRLATVGYGDKKPLFPNDSTDHRASNRRTEYYVEELDGKRVPDGVSGSSDTKVATGTAPTKTKL